MILHAGEQIRIGIIINTHTMIHYYYCCLAHSRLGLGSIQDGLYSNRVSQLTAKESTIRAGNRQNCFAKSMVTSGNQKTPSRRNNLIGCFAIQTYTDGESYLRCCDRRRIERDDLVVQQFFQLLSTDVIFMYCEQMSVRQPATHRYSNPRSNSKNSGSNGGATGSS